MKVTHNRVFGFAIALQARDSVKAFTYKPYVRTNDQDVLYGTPVNAISANLRCQYALLEQLHGKRDQARDVHSRRRSYSATAGLLDVRKSSETLFI